MQVLYKKFKEQWEKPWPGICNWVEVFFISRLNDPVPPTRALFHLFVHADQLRNVNSKFNVGLLMLKNLFIDKIFGKKYALYCTESHNHRLTLLASYSFVGYKCIKTP